MRQFLFVPTAFFTAVFALITISPSTSWRLICNLLRILCEHNFWFTDVSGIRSIHLSPMLHRLRHSHAPKPQGTRPNRQRNLRPQEPDRALLQQTQALPQACNTIRQDNRELSRLRSHRLSTPLVQALCQHDLELLDITQSP